MCVCTLYVTFSADSVCKYKLCCVLVSRLVQHFSGFSGKNFMLLFSEDQSGIKMKESTRHTFL